MPFQRVPDAVQCNIIGEMAGQEIVNTFYGTMAGYALADVQNLAGDVDAWVDTTWLPQMPTNYNYVRTEVKGLNSATDLQATDSTSAGPGTGGGNCPANNAALAIQRNSGLTGRASRGRIYVPVDFSHVSTVTNTVDATLQAGLLAALDALDTVFDSAGFLPVIVHRVSAGVPLAVAVVFTLIEWVVVDNVLDSMRRRLPRRGV